MNTKTIYKITSLATILLASLPSYGQIVNDGKAKIPQPTKAVRNPPDFVVKPQTPQKREQLKKPNDADQIDWGPYMSELHLKITKNWFPPPQTEHAICYPPRVLFNLHKDGTISELHLSHVTGVQEDKAALEAVEKAAPFKPLPPGSKDYESIQYSFERNVFSGSGKGFFQRF